MALVLVLALQFIHLSNPDALRLVSRLDYLVYDARFALLPPKREAVLPVVIVDLDEASIQQEGRWPWDRKKVAQLISQLQQAGAGLIGLDMIFSEPSRNPVTDVMAALPDELRHSEPLMHLQTGFDSDQVLADTLGLNVVLGYFFQNSEVSAGQLPFPFYQLPADQLERVALLSMRGYTANLPLLANNALEQGYLVTVPDMDGVVRRVPLVMRHGEDVYASLSLVMAQIALGAPWVKLLLADNGRELVAVGVNIGDQVTVPLSADGTMLVPFKGYANSFTTISATQVIQQTLTDAQRQQLDGATVLVGTSALGLSDLRTIPLQTSFPGVEVHTNVLDAILQAAMGEATFYQQPDWTPAFAMLLLLITGVLLVWLLPGRTPVVMLLLALGFLLFTVLLNGWFWQVKHLALPLALELFLIALLSAFYLSFGFIEAARSKREVESLFGAYVPPDYVKLMLTQPEKATMEGEQRDMTVLFADVCGFTTLSEALTTQGLKQLLNRYLTEVTKVIFTYHGTIDKYVGDMVMAFWNAPLDDAQHAQNGVLTALAMQRRVAELRDEFVRDGLPPIAVGIGLNSGPMNVGDMGSSYRRAYTVLGDAVNLGSRLEGLTRFYAVDVLVSEDTARQCPDVLFRPIDRIRVKGKNEPVDVFEPLCLQSEAGDVLMAQVRQFEQALAHYRQREFEAAQTLLTNLLAEDTSHAVLYQCYLERIAAFVAEPPAADWQAIHTHTSK